MNFLTPCSAAGYGGATPRAGSRQRWLEPPRPDRGGLPRPLDPLVDPYRSCLDEFFLVLSGEVRVKHGETVIEAVGGSLVYGPRNVAYAFRVDSTEARLLLFFGPAGVERFFREAGKPARSVGLPPADEQFIDREALMQIGNRYGQEYVGPPLPPKD
jgi:hypothetical protein